MKSNDDIPEDEMLLAEAIAAAKARGLGWTWDVPFRDWDHDVSGPETAAFVCALGALHFAGRVDMTNRRFMLGGELSNVIHGNDEPQHWGFDKADRGESLGWAFRCAMTQDEP